MALNASQFCFFCGAVKCHRRQRWVDGETKEKKSGDWLPAGYINTKGNPRDLLTSGDRVKQTNVHNEEDGTLFTFFSQTLRQNILEDSAGGLVVLGTSCQTRVTSKETQPQQDHGIQISVYLDKQTSYIFK